MCVKEIAKKVAYQYLAQNSHQRHVLLFDVATHVDSVLRDRLRWKRKTELYGSLYDYEELVPNAKWISSEELAKSGHLSSLLGGNFLVVENPYYRG